jgi:putative ABC transport system permease protein
VPAVIRWIRSDLRARRAQCAAAAAVVAGVVTALLLSAALLASATNPWPGLFAQTRGAQIWLRLAPGTSVAGLRSRLDGVTAVAGPYRIAPATMVVAGVKAPVQVRAMPLAQPQVGRVLMEQGGWLKRSAPDGVVLEASLAAAVHATPGSRLVLEGLDGSDVPARVIGVGATSDQGYYPDVQPGLMWVQQALLRRVEPVAGHTEEMLGLRLASSAQTGFVVQQVVTQLGSRVVRSVATWQEVERSMARQYPLLGLLLAVFGLVALGAAVLAIATAVGGRVLAQLQDLAMLKTLGFTPAQVTGMLVAEHAALALVGIGAGLGITRLLTTPLLHGLPGLPAAVTPLPAGWAGVISGGTLLGVAAAAALPSWRAGRVRPVAAVRYAPPRGRLSWLARVAMAARLPAPIVLGAHAAFLRRVPALLTVAALAVPMVMITVGLGFWSTLDDVQNHPADIGLAASVTVGPGAATPQQARRLIAADPQVAKAYPGARATALVPGETSTITTLGMGTNARPYPFHVAAGRLYRAPGEAVASQGLLDALHLQVGEFVRMAVGGVPVIFHIVGRIIEPEYGGQVLAYGMDTLSEAGAAAPPVFYSLVLRPGVTPEAARARLMRASGGRLDVETVANPADQLGVVRLMMAGLLVVLAVTGLTSVFTASLVGAQDQARDVRVLRAMGLTPAQVRACLVTRTGLLALIAVGIGAPAGLAVSSRLINLGAQAYGIGAGIGRPPSVPALATAVILAVALAGLVAVVPSPQAASLALTADPALA